MKICIRYYGEIIVLEATSIGLGTCWIGGTYNKKECEKYIDIKEDEELVCVIAIGYTPENKSIKEKLVAAMNKGKKGYNEILKSKDNKVPNWVKSGIESVIKAPSAVNKQPVGYLFEDNKIKAYVVKENHGYEEVDLGISMLNFEIGSKSKGYIGHWTYINNENIFE